MVSSAATVRGNQVRLTEMDPAVEVHSMSCRADPFEALLRALATKIVPGIPYSTRIAVLQQTTRQRCAQYRSRQRRRRRMVKKVSVAIHSR